MRRSGLMRLILGVCGFVFFFSSVMAQDAVELNYGQQAAGSISDAQSSFRYSFQGSEGDSIYITFYSINNSFEPIVRLVASNGSVLVEQDDNNPLGALIGPYVLPGTATYFIEATYGADGGSGDFTLFLDRVAPTVVESPMVAGENILAQQGAVGFFSFEAAPGDVVQYYLQGNNVTAGIITPAGEYLTSYDIGSDISNPFTLLTEAGTYYFAVQTGNSGGSDYRLDLALAELIPLIPGESVSGTAIESTPPVFTFSSEEGQKWRLDAQVADSNYAASILLFGLNDACCALGGDFGSGPNGMPRLDPFTAPSAGVYYALLRFDDYSPENAVRDYQITLSESQVEELVAGSKVSGAITPETGGAAYSYAGQEGEQIRITLTRTDGGGTNIRFVINYTQDEILFFDSRSTPNVSFVVVLPATDTYLMQISNIDTEQPDLQYTISIDAIGN